LLKAVKRVTDEQANLQEKVDDDAGTTADPMPTRKAMLTELHLYSIGISTRKWAHEQQELDDEIAFAITDAGKAADQVLDAQLKEQRRARDKERRERRKEKKAAESAKHDGKKMRNGGRNFKNEAGSIRGLKNGHHDAKNKGRRRKKKDRSNGLGFLRASKKLELFNDHAKKDRTNNSRN
jgi:hypothetical protein